MIEHNYETLAVKSIGLKNQVRRNKTTKIATVFSRLVKYSFTVNLKKIKLKMIKLYGFCCLNRRKLFYSNK